MVVILAANNMARALLDDLLAGPAKPNLAATSFSTSAPRSSTPSVAGHADRGRQFHLGR
jgi:hypothetical protein